MTRRHNTIVVGSVSGAYLLVLMYQDYLHGVSTGASPGWLVLKVLIVVAWLAALSLMSRVQPGIDLEAFTGVRAVACAVFLLPMLAIAIAIGMYLDQFMGSHLSLAFPFASSALVLARWVLLRLPVRLRTRLLPSADEAGTSGSVASAPPN